MSVDRSLISRFTLPQSSVDWEFAFARLLALPTRISLGRWQFLVRLLLVVSLSFSLARLFWLLLPLPSIPPAAVAIATVTSHTGSDGKLVDIAQLKALHVFGKAAEAPKPDAAPAVIENQAVDTHLNLVLLGIVGSSDEKLARAIISSGDKQDVYSVGATLPVGNGVTLSKVLEDRVIINNNGQYESLWLYQNDPNALSLSRQNVAPPPPPPSSQVLPPGRPGPMGPQMHSPESPEQAGDPGMATATRSLSDVVAMSIYRENGQVVGYKIRPGRDAEKFRALGLQTDDIVTAVNGMPLTNPAKIMEVYKNMGNTTSASLEIKRGGSVITVDVVLQ